MLSLLDKKVPVFIGTFFLVDFFTLINADWKSSNKVNHETIDMINWKSNISSNPLSSIGFKLFKFIDSIYKYSLFSAFSGCQPSVYQR